MPCNTCAPYCQFSCMLQTTYHFNIRGRGTGHFTRPHRCPAGAAICPATAHAHCRHSKQPPALADHRFTAIGLKEPPPRAPTHVGGRLRRNAILRPHKPSEALGGGGAAIRRSGGPRGCLGTGLGTGGSTEQLDALLELVGAHGARLVLEHRHAGPAVPMSTRVQAVVLGPLHADVTQIIVIVRYPLREIGQAPALTASEPTHRTRILGAGKMGKMGEMENIGGEWGRNGEMVGIAHGTWVVEGGGGVWLRKMGGNGTKCPFFTVPLSPIFRRSQIFPHNSTCKTQLTALTDGKMGFFATHRHPPPRRLVQMLPRAWDRTRGGQMSGAGVLLRCAVPEGVASC